MKINKLFTETGFKWLWLTVLFLIIDQVTKQLVVNSFDLYESMNILPFFDLRYVQNPGAAFSFLADQDGWQRWFFTIIAAIASVVFLVWLAKTPKNNALLSIALAFMLSGAVGNLIDRALFGYVIDFLDFYIADNHWPAFNVADSAIFIGAALMIFDSFKNGDSAKKTEITKTKVDEK
ncbi:MULTISPECIES: signal peptidase II [unclassified Colwellia]|jgi:signal peptidase II|uniref:signal peptidase II n=1 Tax=unclassified Colwellia TaxID=196834 RepID=UPI0015F6CD80|nr:MULTISPECIES: signal peptidase II [unclassified Colwellia]MBA6335597.1 signal peptidase II [Colwellia sp. BRX8-7]MBA6349988.1 signal peptidase II [Colwellia sp. BRX8-9]MBA6353954.1 signal peptidase II [Colwellia sp. BRX9-1]MBA6356901.1 signal peptidase II [Colwellia sp. BRX8-3]MBA6360612.1 signal peptidase II [Colwellia sp. BRX8-6]